MKNLSSLLTFALTLSSLQIVCFGNAEVRILMEIKASLDPQNKHLTSWTESGDPCTGSFAGVACNDHLKVANISLQGKGLTGKLPAALSGLKCLSGLYLHYNFLTGEIPREISNLTELSELYLNVNNLSGEIPPAIGNVASLQVMELCCNQLSGSIPTEIGSLKKLTVVALQHNRLTGGIPRTLGDLGMLKRLDLSFNELTGQVPVNLAKAPQLEFLDVHSNNLSGFVPPGLRQLNGGFSYKDNRDLCGSGFPMLRQCTAFDQENIKQPESFTPIPQSADVIPRCNDTTCSTSSNFRQVAIITTVATIVLSLMVAAFIATFIYRRRKQKIWSRSETSDDRVSVDQVKDFPTRPSPTGFHPELDSLQGFKFNLEEIESATRYFSEANLLGRSKFSSVYKGVLRDRSVVAMKCITATSCKAEEEEFGRGLRLVMSLKHENLVRLRGFCCSKGRRECFLVYDFASRGSLVQYLDVEDGRSGHVLDWPKRVSIINGIAKGLAYLHSHDSDKPAMIHRNISMDKILIDQQYKPLITDAGLLKLLADDIVFSALKVSAALGYMAPEYVTTGRFTEKSDVYAFGVVVLQILSGKTNLTASIRAAAAAGSIDDFVDRNLEGRFSRPEAEKLTKIGVVCVDEGPENRPTMEAVVRALTVSG